MTSNRQQRLHDLDLEVAIEILKYANYYQYGKLINIDFYSFKYLTEQEKLYFQKSYDKILAQCSLTRLKFDDKVPPRRKALKKEIHENGLYARFKICNKKRYLINNTNYQQGLTIEQNSFDRYYLLETFKSGNTGDLEYEYLREAQRELNAEKARKKRLNKRIKDYFDYANKHAIMAYFLTLTFDDDTLLNTNEKTRHRYIKDFMHNHFKFYLANVDYGELNEREHYHAIVLCDSDIHDILVKYKYGFTHFEKCRISEVDAVRTSTYITKFTNHATKSTTYQNRVIYSESKLD